MAENIATGDRATGDRGTGAERQLPRHDDLMNLRHRCLMALRNAMANRGTFAGLEWIDHERQAITEAANVWALAHCLPTVTVDQVEAVEHLAEGHIDYAEKLALYVAELTYGLRVTA